MLLARGILGEVGEPRFAGRTVERLLLDSGDASKRRLRARTDEGTDIGVDLERGAYLKHGAVLADDGVRVVVVERKPEEAMVVRLAADLDPAERLRQAVRLGHAFGNQHVPLEVEESEIRIPITTSRQIVGETVRSLQLDGAEVSFELVQLGRDRPLQAPAHAHRHE